jgi:hypothetical protein
MAKFARTVLYNVVEYEPLTYQGLQNENLIKRLKNLNTPRHHSELPNLYTEMMFRENELYDQRYLKWSLTYDYPAGQIYVQSRENQLAQPLYRLYVEYDYN